VRCVSTTTDQCLHKKEGGWRDVHTRRARNGRAKTFYQTMREHDITRRSFLKSKELAILTSFS
jgi:hypothetical protein